ncbi:hypothetical protein JK192_01645 [Gluconobacter cerinus]|uniref:hypothetical protein n=2 Tax=Gluconobacter cerinus TaxID=38307 RepID=UPI001B8B6EFD|nr:hypothetical protein [Gluconobacter cerinus]MBS1030091.1 hypothetical protein [Gluconobacter cerinus]
MKKKTAVLFKCHNWDSVIQRSYERCKRHSNKSDFYIVYDSTKGVVEIPEHIQKTENIFLAPYLAVENLGLAWGTEVGNYGGYWYNGDYHQNLFIINNPDYDYICSVENDVVVLNDFDHIFEDMDSRNIDAVYKHVGAENHAWAHSGSCEGYYDLSQHIHKGLFCISFFSRKAALLILKRRLEMSVLKREKGLLTWPIGEAVMSHEIISAGMRTEELAHYCDSLRQYDWAPVYLEKEIINETEKTFIHPVTEMNEKFIVSNFVQDYHCMISEEEISNGISRHRSRKINDFEAYSRLFHCPRIYNNPVLREDVVDDARELLTGVDFDLASEGMALDWPQALGQVYSEYPERVCASLPSYDRSHAMFFDREVTLQVSLGADQAYTLILAARDPDLTSHFDVKCKGEISSFENVPVAFCQQKGELRFYAVNFPAKSNEFVVEQKGPDGFWLNFMKILPTTDALRALSTS